VREGVAAEPDRGVAFRRLAAFLVITTLLNVLIGAQLTYRAVEYMETRSFCGQSCHVMKPEFTASQNSSHSRLGCVECHVAPGATGWVESKMAGTRQLFEVMFNSYPRPIPSAIESHRLVPANATCENCHWPDKFTGSKLRVIPNFAEDEANTATRTVLMMKVGGAGNGGIHGAHFGAGISLRFAAADAKRQTLPWVEYNDRGRGISRTYVAQGATAAEINKLPKYEIQCVDCHNRPTHTFETPERAVQQAMAAGEISQALPFIRKKGVEVLKAGYTSESDAATRIPQTIRDYYQTSHTEIASTRPAEIKKAADTLLAIYNRNVFPDLKVTWGTYANNLGHTDYPGCFRCHDDSHSSSDQKTIGQDCASCHEMLAVDEASPEILKTLGWAGPTAALQRK
jgi:nitrate/TMAO reductase-like tetraheme cytochrome c subunit